jgi:hypothetical protein
MVISIDGHKASDDIQHPFMIKMWKRLGTEGTYITKAIHNNLTVYSANILNGEMLNNLSNTWNRARFSTFSTVLEILADQAKGRNKGHPNWKIIQVIEVCI